MTPIESAERNAYRAFAVKLGKHFTAPDAEDMAARHLAPGDLDDLADHVIERHRAAWAEVRQLRAQLAAYADLPPEPEPSPMAAFLAVLATDNHPDNADGGGDCDGLR